MARAGPERETSRHLLLLSLHPLILGSLCRSLAVGREGQSAAVGTSCSIISGLALCQLPGAFGTISDASNMGGDAQNLPGQWTEGSGGHSHRPSPPSTSPAPALRHRRLPPPAPHSDLI